MPRPSAAPARRVALSLLAAGTAGLVYPFRPEWALPAALGAAGLGLLLLRGSRRAFLLLATIPIVLGNLEWLALALTRAGLVPYEIPLLAVLSRPSDRRTNLPCIPDRYRVSDPLLFWRPVPQGPYTRQRFRGPLVETPKPAGVFRILCYGDSLTDGLPETSWPLELQKLLPAGYEVLDAGVAGYTSHQGLLRFQEEVGPYQPDLVLVCFGWNDPMAASGRPDRDFPVPSPAIVALQRFFLHYRGTLCLRRVLRPETPLDALNSDPTRPRVPSDDYLANLDGFVYAARAHGAVPVLLTRPFLKRQVEAQYPEWAWRVPPLYNGRLLEMASVHGIATLDAEARFRDRSERFLDVCHLDAEGHREMARFVLTELQRASLLPPQGPASESEKERILRPPAGS